MANFISTTFIATIVCFVYNLAQADANQSVQKINRTNLSNIIFPSLDTNKNHESSHNRPPLLNLNPCLESELFYPGDNVGDWVCDCKSGYLHYPLTSMCYESHTQGPCENNEIIILPKNSSIPECVDNVCAQKEVFFNGSCFPLGSENGCTKYELFVGRKILLLVDATSLGLICADEEFKYVCTDDCCKARESKLGVKDVCLNNTESTTVKASIEKFVTSFNQPIEKVDKQT